MDDGLKQYLDSRGAVPLDSAILETYSDEMVETVIPQIVDDIEQRELLAAELRVLPPTISRSEVGAFSSSSIHA